MEQRTQPHSNTHMNQTKTKIKEKNREKWCINSSNSKEKQSRLTLAIAESVLGFWSLVFGFFFALLRVRIVKWKRVWQTPYLKRKKEIMCCVSERESRVMLAWHCVIDHYDDGVEIVLYVVYICMYVCVCVWTVCTMMYCACMYMIWDWSV